MNAADQRMGQNLDQAGELRRIVEENMTRIKAQRDQFRVVTVLSGKGGVGKSNLSAALACALADLGRRVVLLDADLGMANLDLLFGVRAKYTLAHLVRGGQGLEDILLPLEERLTLLPGGVGIQEMADLDGVSMERVFEALASLEERAELIVLDVGAGIHEAVLSFAQAADMTLLVTTPEPTSIRDVYGVVKSLGTWGGLRSLVVNMAGSAKEAQEVSERIRLASMQFLGDAPSYLGYVLRDEAVARSVRNRKLFFRAAPSSPASKCVRNLAEELLRILEGRVPKDRGVGGVKAFFRRLMLGFTH